VGVRTRELRSTIPGSLASQQEAILDQLLGPSQIRIAFHSIHELQNGNATFGQEALMRGPRGAPYESPPLAFAMAATLDQIERLDCHCIRLAAEHADASRKLFLNVHPRTLVRHENFWGLVGDLPAISGLAPDSIVFEIVEHSPANESELPAALRELRELGFRIAVDDLGEGMSGLRRLIEVEPEYMKIDRFFVTGVDRDRRRRSMVTAIVRMGEDLGIDVIAEGIEEATELRVLQDVGVRFGQGWYFGRPEEVAHGG
jgi:EAL domain-containing protein (putative c-di-GMP-specific phosphodiesterase class I)